MFVRDGLGVVGFDFGNQSDVGMKETEGTLLTLPTNNIMDKRLARVNRLSSSLQPDFPEMKV
jgi:hypothetical protein